MSTPPKQTELWKNVTWKDNNEKLAFFNHYFKRSQMVTDRVDNEVRRIVGRLQFLIKENKINLPGNKTRPLTIADIREELKRMKP